MRIDAIFTDVWNKTETSQNTALINHLPDGQGRCLIIWYRDGSKCERVHESTAKTLRTLKHRLAKFKTQQILQSIR